MVIEYHSDENSGIFHYPLLDLRPTQEKFTNYQIYWLKNKLVVCNDISSRHSIFISVFIV